jgi:PAS domain S-box-containing protein
MTNEEPADLGPSPLYRQAIDERDPHNVSAIVMADSTGRIRHWSPGAERMFGYEAAAAVGQSLDLIVPEQFRKGHWAGFNRVMGGGPTHYDGVNNMVEVRCADGLVREFPARFRIVRDRTDAAIGAMVVFSEPTQEG